MFLTPGLKIHMPRAHGSQLPLGWATKHLKALQEPHGRVFMASADWAQGWRGFIDGAIEQGTRAAAVINFALEQESGNIEAKL